MTLSTSNNTQTYTGDNSTKPFSFPFLFFANGDLTVTLDGTTKVLDTDYTVTGAGVAAGGTVTFTTAPGTGVAIVIQRIVAFVQQTDFENFDGNPADVTEKQFDLTVMQTQQNNEQIARSILAPIGTALTSNTITGTIDTTVRALTITTAGPASSDLSVFPDDIDVVLTAVVSGDFLRHDGTNFVNVTEIVTADIADNAIDETKLKDALIADFTEVVVTAADSILLGDATDSGNTKRDTVQGILDLVPATSLKIIQVQTTTKTDTFTMTSSTFADVTGLSVSITPTLSSSTILVIVNISGGSNVSTDNGTFIRLLRDSTNIAIADSDSSNRIEATTSLTSHATNSMATAGISFIDSPSTTSATTYKIQVAAGSSGDAYINRTPSDSDATSIVRGVSSITVMEIGA